MGKKRACKQTEHGKRCLGVTRALGDNDLSKLGLLLGVPKMERLDVQPGDVILVASDGLWDMVDIDTILRVLDDFYSQGRTQVVQQLSRLAASAWNAKRPEERDDISIVLWRAPAGMAGSADAVPGKPLQTSEQWLMNGDVGDWCLVNARKGEFRKPDPRQLTGGLMTGGVTGIALSSFTKMLVN